MYDPQREFMHGLLAAKGMSMEDYAKLLFDTKQIDHPDHPNYLKFLTDKDIEASETPRALQRTLTMVGYLTDSGIRGAQGDMADSSIEAVEYFSSDINTPLDQLIHAWQPKNYHSQTWKKEMISYVNGQWFNEMRELIPHR